MIHVGSLLISLAEVLGLLVTIVGIWLVVMQLRETKLASQMEGLLTLGQMDSGNSTNWNRALELINGQDWKAMKASEAHELFHETDSISKAFDEITVFFELMSVLVRRKALDKRMAYDMYGNAVPRWWKRLEKVIEHHRVETNDDSIGKNWEWLADEFEKRSA